MTMVNESGAIVDPSELAASAGDDGLVEDIGDLSDVEILDEVTVDGITSTLDDGAAEEAEQFGLLTDSVEHLRSIHREIKNIGCISRAEAVSIRGLTASSESLDRMFQQMPLNSYTELASMVNYKATNEGLLSAIGESIAKVIKAIWTFIQNAAKYMFNGVSMRISKNKRAAAADRAIDKRLAEIKGTDIYDVKLDKVLAVRKQWSELDRYLLTGSLNKPDTEIGIHNIKRLAESLSETTNRLEVLLPTAGTSALINVPNQLSQNTNYGEALRGIAGITGSLVPNDNLNDQVLVKLLDDYNEFVLKRVRAKVQMDRHDMQLIVESSVDGYDQFNKLFVYLGDVNKRLEKIIGLVNAQVTKHMHSDEAFLNNRQDCAILAKSLQQHAQGLYRIMSTLMMSRDFISQIRLEVAR